MLEVALCLTPLNLALIGADGFTAYRLKCQGEWTNTGLGHMKFEFLQKYPFTLKQERILKKYKLVEQYKALTPTRADWCMPVKLPTLTLTFGTQTGQELATALVQVFGKRTTIRRVFLWASSLVFKAEVKAILRCTD